MDPFEVRMQFLGLLRRLDAYVLLSTARPDVLNDRQLPTVHKKDRRLCREVLSLLRGRPVGLHARGVPEGAADTHVRTFRDEDSNHSRQGSLNSRINILYLVDSLCEASLLSKPPPGVSQPSSSYVNYVTRDLRKVVDGVVPEGRQGLPNLMSTRQVRATPVLLRLRLTSRRSWKAGGPNASSSRKR